MADIEKTRGERLACTIVLQDGTTNISASTGNGYSIEAQMSNVKGGSEQYDLGAAFSNGAGVINYDTTNLSAGIYYFDIKFGFPTGETRWSNTVSMLVAEPITDA